MEETYKPYTTRNGKQRFKPSLELIKEMDESNQGFCIACAHEQYGCEPDAVRYECDNCGEHLVFGSLELAAMGLCY